MISKDYIIYLINIDNSILLILKNNPQVLHNVIKLYLIDHSSLLM